MQVTYHRAYESPPAILTNALISMTAPGKPTLHFERRPTTEGVYAFAEPPHLDANRHPGRKDRVQEYSSKP